MSAQVQVLQPHSSYLKAFNEYYSLPVSNTLSTANTTAIAVGGKQDPCVCCVRTLFFIFTHLFLVVLFVLLIIVIIIIIYCCRHRRAGYQSAYDTDEALGHSQLYSADEALRSKTNGHPDVKPELFI
ncbi:unnamed protein product [Taenia asiatica]|uniref:4.1m domain-containing protein n=1 Tax=Taenia asiatica TaxID=60517 RepID=A0A0R3W7I2_TAEAS|nr:unnamed protein product [Taenia asiatica]